MIAKTAQWTANSPAPARRSQPPPPASSQSHPQGPPPPYAHGKGGARAADYMFG